MLNKWVSSFVTTQQFVANLSDEQMHEVHELILKKLAANGYIETAE